MIGLRRLLRKSVRSTEALRSEESSVPGKQVKNWKQYHGLRRKGMSKTKAAKIANSKKRGGRKKKR